MTISHRPDFPASEVSAVKQLRTQHEPPIAGPELEIFRVKDNHIYPYVILSKGLFGLFTHWDAKARKGKGASSACYRNPEDCDGCRRRLPERWKGYIHVLDLQTRKDGFLEFTPRAAAMLKAQLTGVENWRLCRINVTRQGKDEHTRLKVTVFDSAKDNGEFPKERCPTETLGKLWKLTTELDDVDQPTIKLHGGTSSEGERSGGRQAASN